MLGNKVMRESERVVSEMCMLRWIMEVKEQD